MTHDNIADMLTRIRNASLVKQKSTTVTYSKLNIAILQIFLTENYILGFDIITIPSFNHKNSQQKITVYLKYEGWWLKEKMFTSIVRVSKPGNRLFSSYKNFGKCIKALNFNQGLAIISTSLGLMSHHKASLLRLGGEILCYVE
jgi:small subunit ribosomal protein S8